MADLRHITHWVFDLDNTLYPSDAPIMTQVDRRMTAYVARLLDLPHDEARKVQKAYWHDYGTTLNGLMANHAVDMREFLDFVHDVDPTVITPHPELASRIEALPGKRLVYTNGSLSHAENILGHMGLTHLFDDIFDVEASGFQPKPHQAGFDSFVADSDTNLCFATGKVGQRRLQELFLFTSRRVGQDRLVLRRWGSKDSVCHSCKSLWGWHKFR